MFLERGEGREKERERNIHVGCLSHTPFWGPGLQPRHVPRMGIEPVTLWFTGWCSVHWATPTRALFYRLLYLFIHSSWWETWGWGERQTFNDLPTVCIGFPPLRSPWGGAMRARHQPTCDRSKPRVRTGALAQWHQSSQGWYYSHSPPLRTEEGERLLFSNVNKRALGRGRNLSEFVWLVYPILWNVTNASPALSFEEAPQNITVD